MALIKCNECGKEISDKATSCINCGAPIEDGTQYIPPSSDKYKVKFVDIPKNNRVLKFIIIIGLGVWGMVYMFSSETRMTTEELAEKSARDKKRNRAYLVTSHCEEVIKFSLKFPSSYKYVGNEYIPSDDQGNGEKVKVKYEAKNDFGNELPYSGQCIVNNNSIKYLGSVGR